MNEQRLMRRSRWPAATVVAGLLVLLAPMVGQAAGAPVLAVTPSTNGNFDYGTVNPGQTASQVFTVRNSGGSGTGALTIALAGSLAFTKTADTCTGNGLGPGKSCTVTVQYRPTVAGQTDVATLTATGARPAVRASITLNGSGTPASDVAPSVQSTSPANGDLHVAVNSNVVVNFSEPVAATTSSFTLECPAGAPQGFTVNGSPGSSITLDSTADLPEGTNCSVAVIANQVSDVDSVDPPDHMAADYALSFMTDSAPAMTTATPADGATDVDPAANVTVYFTEPVAVTTSSFWFSCNGILLTFTVSGSGTSTITLDPDSDLPMAASCTVMSDGTNIIDVDSGDPPDHPVANVFVGFTTRGPAAASCLYWTNYDRNTIGSADLDGQNVNQSFITGAPGPFGLAVDSDHIYWTNYGTNSIGRADLSGQNVDQSFITGAVNPAGVAVDASHIYWTNLGTNTIGRADLDGQNPSLGFIHFASAPYGIGVDSGHVYWANWDSDTIGRADIDGQNANQSFISGANRPIGLAVDSGHIYWANNGSIDTIGRADLDGQNVNHGFITGTFASSGVAVDSDHLYWTNLGNDTIGRADADGLNVNQSFITGVSYPAGVAVGCR